MTSAREWVPEVSRDLKMARFQHRPMRNKVRLLVLFLAAQYMLESSHDLLDLLGAPFFFRHTNGHRINGRKPRDRGKKSGFCAIVERLSCTTLQYYMYWKRMECQLTGMFGGQINFSSFRKWSSSDGANAWVFWNDLGSSFKIQRNLRVSTRSFDGQLLENSSSRMRSQGPNDRVHARVLNFSSRWVSVWTRLLIWNGECQMPLYPTDSLFNLDAVYF